MKQLVLEHKPIIDESPDSRLSQAYSAGSGSIVVDNAEDFFATDSYVWLDYGKENAEIIQVASRSGNTLTLSANTAYAHNIGATVHSLNYNQVRFYRSTTTIGSPTELATVDLTASSGSTVYNDLVNTTGFAYIKLYNEATDTLETVFTGPDPYLVSTLSGRSIFDTALINLNLESKAIVDDDWAIHQLNYLEGVYAQKMKRPIEVQVKEYSLGTLEQGDWKLSMPTNIAEKNTFRSVETVRIMGSIELEFKPKDRFDDYLRNSFYGYLNGQIVSGATSILLDSAAGLPSSGSVKIGSDTVTYTGISTNTLTGVTGVTQTHATGKLVSQNIEQGVPRFYTIWGDELYVYPIMGDEKAGFPIIMDYYSKLGSRIQSIYDEVIFDSPQIAVSWLEKRLMRREKKGDYSSGERESGREMEQFMQDYLMKQGVPSSNVLRHKLDARMKRRRIF